MLQELELDSAKPIAKPEPLLALKRLLQPVLQSKAVLWSVGLIFPLLLLYTWQIAVERNWVNTLLLPPPDVPYSRSLYLADV